MNSDTKTVRDPYLPVASLAIVGLFALFLAGHLVPALQGAIIPLSPWIYLVAGGLSLYPSVRSGGRPFIVWSSLTFIVVFILSALGAANDQLFGAYSYGPTLGPQLFDSPLIWTFNWVLVLYAATRFAQARLQGTSGVVGESIVAVCTGIVIMFYEWMIIPLATRMDYWNFDTGTAPPRHYVAWLLLGTIASFTYLYYIFPRIQKRTVSEDAIRHEHSTSRLIGLYALCQLVMLLVCRLFWAIAG